MRKIDCISFRITGNTNYKKLTSFVSKYVLRNRAESQNCKGSQTQPTLKQCFSNLDVVLRLFFELLL